MRLPVKYMLIAGIPVTIIGLYFALVIATRNFPPGAVVEPGSPPARPINLR